MRDIRDFYDVIIVGGGPSSRILNKYLHIFSEGIETIVIRDEERIVNHCGTPYIVEGRIPWNKGLISDQLVLKFDTPILVDPMVGGDVEAHQITTASGRTLGYGRLVLATGTDQVLPPIPGIDLDGVFKVRRTDDLKKTMAEIPDVEHVTVLGAGYIGLEFAVALRNLGKKVTVVEMADHVMGGITDQKMAEAIENHLKDFGIQLLTGRRATRLLGDAAVSAVEVDGGGTIETDAVLSAVGVRPLLEVAAALGLECCREGIIVDEFFKTSAEDVFATGDCIQVWSIITGRPIAGKLGSNAGQMARRLAMNFSGFEKPFSGVINAVVTHLEGLSYGAAGLSEAAAESEGFETVITRNTSSSIYENMPGTEPVEAKLIYEAESLRLLGGEIIGRLNPAGFVETLAQLIERGSTLEDVLTMSYSSHPELTPKTSKPFWIWASEPLLRSLIRSGRF
jgi:NADPH-dependent 2,4-dienoyl-CoA reductase/sulfur reductase-like enzyme